MLHEAYRPVNWAQMVGQDAVIAKVRRLEQSKDGLAGRAYWISGKSGNGKTTLARIIAASVSDKNYTRELDAKELTSGVLESIKDDMAYVPMGVSTRAYIVNEAHRLNSDRVTKLLNMLEAPILDSGTLWVFTTTLEGQLHFEGSQMDSSPLLSRCVELRLTERGVCRPMAIRCKEIAEAEKLDGRPLADYERLLKDLRNNMRRALQHIEAGAMLKG